MSKSTIKNHIAATLIAASLLTSASCHREYIRENIEGCTIAVSDASTKSCRKEISELLEKGKRAVDSIKSPIIGEAAIRMTVEPPQSELMNFAADALRNEAALYTKEKIDIAITNKGGLRSEIHAGEITYGDIYNVFPFENTLITITLNGEQLRQLFDEIAKAGGEAVSGVEMVISDYPNNPHCEELRVGNDHLSKENESLIKKEYRIATSDYLAQGNDGLKTLAQGYNKREHNITLRDLMIRHISRLYKQGKSISAQRDGRVKTIASTTKE